MTPTVEFDYPDVWSLLAQLDKLRVDNLARAAPATTWTRSVTDMQDNRRAPSGLA
jgi:hypothetical protein